MMEELKTLQKIANPDRDNAGPYKLYPSHLQHYIPSHAAGQNS